MERPTSVTVFGILHLLFGALGVCGVAMNFFTLAAVFSDNSQFSSPLLDHPLGRFQTVVSVVLSVPLTIALIAAGIGLLLMKSWARVLSVIYGAFSVVSTIFSLIAWGIVGVPLLFDQQQALPPEVVGGLIGGLCGGMIGLVYPALVWYFMTRPWIVSAFEHQQPTPDWTYAPPTATATLPPLGPTTDNPFAAPQAATSAAPVAMPGNQPPTFVDSLIPARNGPALASYYLGLFSLFPLLGLPLAIAALVLGVKGLRKVRETPEVRGRVHAWIGVICGSIFGLFNLLLATVTAIGLGAMLIGP